MTQLHEKPRSKPWAVTDAPEAFVKSPLKGIIGMKLSISRIEGKVEMSQNRNEADRRGVADGLAASTDTRDRAVGKMVL